MKRTFTALSIGFLLLAGTGIAQSPAANTEVTINGKKVSIQYSAPSLRGRKDIFGKDGPIAKDSTYPVWRAGANAATTLTTEADLTIGSLRLPKGAYSLYVDIGANPWQLIVNKQTGHDGSSYDKSQDLGRVPMKISKPAATVETYKMTLSKGQGNNGKLELAWENVVASVDFTVR
jgi:hypothetical protein